LEAPFRPGDESLKIKWFSLRPLFDLSLQRRDVSCSNYPWKGKGLEALFWVRGVPERKVLSCPLHNLSLKGTEPETQTRPEMRP
jgi:hypothetical protein